MKLIISLAFLVVLPTIVLCSPQSQGNPFLITITGAREPARYQHMKAPIKEYSIEQLVSREMPEIFEDFSEVTFSLAAQDHTAPLIFIIPGTGGNYKAGKMRFLQKLFWEKGFHAVSLNSPLNRNFITTSSRSALPGHSLDDARDLYEVMKKVIKEVEEDINVSDFYLAGYSLGGLQACFVAHVDESQKKFNFKRVLTINPPLNLYSSISLLDDYLRPRKNIKKDLFTRMMDKVALYFALDGNLSSDKDLFYRVHQVSPITQLDAEQIIGLSFRMTLAELVFICDILHKKKYIIENDPTFTTPLLPYFKKSLLWTFRDYVKHFLAPAWLTNNPDKTFKDFVHITSLESLAHYIQSSSKFKLIHNEDDIILANGELNRLKQIFSEATIYPTGGHLGNFYSEQVVEEITKFASEGYSK